MKVKAVINIDVGGPLVIDDLDIGDPGPTHVIVKQFATGVCHSQLHQIHNPALPRPLVLGHESTGVVVAKGREVTHVNEGDRVMLTWVQRDRFAHTPDPTPWRATYQGKQARHEAGPRSGGANSLHLLSPERNGWCARRSKVDAGSERPAKSGPYTRTSKLWSANCKIARH